MKKMRVLYINKYVVILKREVKLRIKNDVQVNRLVYLYFRFSSVLIFLICKFFSNIPHSVLIYLIFLSMLLICFALLSFIYH